MIGWVFVAFALTGSVLNVRKNRWCFAFWLASNVGLFAINVSIEQWPQAALFVVYAGLSVWGFVSWRDEK